MKEKEKEKNNVGVFDHLARLQPQVCAYAALHYQPCCERKETSVDARARGCIYRLTD